MPRHKSAVKIKNTTALPSRLELLDYGAVDIHFHGAFGVDLMTAEKSSLDSLAEQLWQANVAAFCPTTISSSPMVLKAAVGRIGRWIAAFQPNKGRRSAIPLGIHLEGPFLNSHSCGAHPKKSIRPFDFEELETLWHESQKTLKILTFAPELLTQRELGKLIAWSQKREIHLSLGHSRATEAEAGAAFRAGIPGMTHAWNALLFHHRAPGPLGAAIGNDQVTIELILDQVHVSPTVIRWTRKLHPPAKLCFISDCVPVAGTSSSNIPGTQGVKSKQYAFGPLLVHYKDGAARLPGGQLAGGGKLLPESYAAWLKAEASELGVHPYSILCESLRGLNRVPMAALGISMALLRRHRVLWSVNRTGTLHAEPVSS